MVTMRVGRAVVRASLWAGRAVVHVVRVAVQADQVVRRLGMDGPRRDRDGRRVSRTELEGGAGAVGRAQVGGPT